MNQTKVETKNSPHKPNGSGCIAYRYMFALCGLMGCIVSYAMRSNISVAMVAMVKVAAAAKSNTSECSPSDVIFMNGTAVDMGGGNGDDGEFDWNEELQGIILGGYFWGYMIPQVLAGRLAEKYSAKRVVLIGGAIGVVATMMGPIAARTNVWLFVATRVLCGLGLSVLTPSCHCLIARWSHPTERSRMAAFVYSGSQLGVIISLPIAGFVSGLESDGGWPWAFYVFGIVGAFWLVMWAFLVYDTPSKHPYISKEERSYVEDSLLEEVNSKVEKPPVPWNHLVKSKPLWSLAWAHFGHNWAFYTLLTQMPTYMENILGFSIEENGIYSSLPYILMMGNGILNSIIADYVIKRKIASVAVVRKTCNTIALYGSAACLFAITFLKCETTVIYVLLVLAVGFDGGIYSGYQVNQVDLSPNFAGTLQAITNTLACVPGILSPFITGIITNGQQTRQRWSIVFYITIVIMVLFATQFWIFGKGNVQYWNNLNEESVEKEDNDEEKGNYSKGNDIGTYGSIVGCTDVKTK